MSEDASNGAELEGGRGCGAGTDEALWPWHRIEVVGREVVASRRGWGCFGRSVS